MLQWKPEHACDFPLTIETLDQWDHGGTDVSNSSVLRIRGDFFAVLLLLYN